MKDDCKVIEEEERETGPNPQRIVIWLTFRDSLRWWRQRRL